MSQYRIIDSMPRVYSQLSMPVSCAVLCCAVLCSVQGGVLLFMLQACMQKTRIDIKGKRIAERFDLFHFQVYDVSGVQPIAAVERLTIATIESALQPRVRKREGGRERASASTPYFIIYDRLLIKERHAFFKFTPEPVPGTGRRARSPTPFVLRTQHWV